MRRITVTLLDEEREALQILAERERRNTRQQAALLIRSELRRHGLLDETAVAPQQFQSDKTGGRNE